MLAVAAAPLVVVPIVMLTQLLGFAVAFGLLYVYRRSLSALITRFADWIGGFGISVRGFGAHPFGPVATQLRNFDSAIEQALENWVRGSEIAIAGLWDVMASGLERTLQFHVDLANSVAGAFTTVTRETIPGAVNDSLRWTKRRLEADAASIARLTSIAIPRIDARLDVFGRRWADVARDLRGLGSRVRAHGKLLSASGFAALTMIALRRMGLAWLRCGNVRRMGRRLCGLDPSILDAALIAGLVLSGPLSIERVTRELLGTMDTFEAALRRGFTEI